MVYITVTNDQFNNFICFHSFLWSFLFGVFGCYSMGWDAFNLFFIVAFLHVIPALFIYLLLGLAFMLAGWFISLICILFTKETALRLFWI
ncbi:Uncharacterised protein [Helicobacter mustelae]|nr:Uncharacterised protein [Helicobacter mustelae]